MSPVLGIIASSIQKGGGPISSYDSLASVVVGSGGASSITFSSIPSGYQHLQIRSLNKVDAGTPDMVMYFNNDTGANYNFHILRGNGSTVTSERYINASIANPVSTYFQASVIDVLDYTSTSKRKTSRNLVGRDNSGAGEVGIWSHLWFATPAAISSITFTLTTATNFSQYSSFALYGVK
jgi:hypothetical protein